MFTAFLQTARPTEGGCFARKTHSFRFFMIKSPGGGGGAWMGATSGPCRAAWACGRGLAARLRRAQGSAQCAGLRTQERAAAPRGAAGRHPSSPLVCPRLSLGFPFGLFVTLRWVPHE